MEMECLHAIKSNCHYFLLQGSDCVHPFVALQNCIKANPDAFSKDILDDDEAQKEEARKEETPTQQYKIIPPIWSVESKDKKHKS